MRLLRARAIAFRGSLASLLLGALLPLAVGITLYTVTARTIDSDARARFEVMARFAQFTIHTRIKSHTDLLRGAAGLFRSHPDTTADQFHEYVEPLGLHSNFPELEAINYAPHINNAQRATLEQELHRQFSSQGVADKPAIWPAGQRSSYTPLLYQEPRTKFSWQGRLGFDLAVLYESELARMRDGNIPTTSDPQFQNFNGGPNQYVPLRLPVYRGGMPTASLDQRRAAFIGTVGSMIAMRTLVSGILEEMSATGIRLTLTDVVPMLTDKSRPTASDLVDSRPEADSTAPEQGGSADILRTSLPVEFLHRRWRADFSAPKSTLYTRFDTIYPLLTGLAGSLMTALLYALLLTRNVAAAHRQVDRVDDQRIA